MKSPKSPPSREIPDKLYFKIGEVSKLTQLPSHVLRFWETEFKQIRPKRTTSGQRLYRRRDVETVFEIKHLLYDKKYTIPGARMRLADKTRPKQPQSISPLLDEIRQTLENIRNILS